jgi:hypothetical protein
VVSALQLLHTEAVALMLARLGLVVVTPLLVAGALATPQLVTATQSAAPNMSNPEPSSAIDFLAVPRGEFGGDPNEEHATDVYGNEVTAAVATYEIDATGSLYELHSPQTQLPRPGSPKS